MVAIDLAHFVDRDGTGNRHRPINDNRDLTPQPLASMEAVFLALPMVVLVSVLVAKGVNRGKEFFLNVIYMYYTENDTGVIQPFCHNHYYRSVRGLI